MDAMYYNITWTFNNHSLLRDGDLFNYIRDKKDPKRGYYSLKYSLIFLNMNLSGICH